MFFFNQMIISSKPYIMADFLYRTVVESEFKTGSGSELRFQKVYNNSYYIKKHWNTINLEGNLPESEIFKMIDMSYELVVKSLPKKDREKLNKISI
ncbi:MAG: hypothetical protein GY760_20205 [Deltaproteobacteria bacterium]|nr:hypothetical protein [Deltaproteobacteria bacterium]